jgi:pimeloyl-ACP methyl ester carboxylesterase
MKHKNSFDKICWDILIHLAIVITTACGGGTGKVAEPPTERFTPVSVRVDSIPADSIAINASHFSSATEAPLDAELAVLGDARALWLGEPGNRSYVVEMGQTWARRVSGDSGVVPLVLVHGLGENGMRDFYPVVAALSKNRPLLLIDLPGTGRSEAPEDAALSPVFFAAWVAETIIARIEGAFDLLGHSLGGNVCLTLAAHPDLALRKLVIVDAAGVLHREAFVKSQVDAGTSPVSKIHRGLGRIVTGVSRTITEASASLEPSETWIGNSAGRLSPGGTKSALALILHRTGPYLAGIDAPTLLVWGEQDTVAPLRTGWLLRDQLANASLSVIPGVGHVPMVDAPGELVQRILAFLDSPMRADEKALSRTNGETQSQLRRESRRVDCRTDGQRQFTGMYSTLHLTDCPDITVENAEIDRLVLNNSSVHLVSVRVSKGTVAVHSVLKMTGGEFTGQIGLSMTDATADIAGSRISGSRYAITAHRSARLLFSVTLVDSPLNHGSIHDRVVLGDCEAI